MIPIHELRVELPADDIRRVPSSGSLAPRARDMEAIAATGVELERFALFEEQHHDALRESYPHLHNPYRFCFEHFVILGEELMNPWLRHNDTIICERLTEKINHGPMIREPNDGWWRRVEEENKDRVWPGDAFLVRRDERECEYFTEPMRQLPADWTPCAGTPPQQQDERVRALRTINKDRAKATCMVTYDYLTVYTKTGRWRRKMVAYEQGTPSPFTFEYYDARNHHPLFKDNLSAC
jgi:hypothetical protein